ncbi:hypothetical protein [Oceanobacter kriegii]|uniref:hypothetical protein n=1 Tax=Oceanobacter kriegii TaxID=64972 RepID=UPI000408FA7E|nr:hypothetical protein [Oceanobacter kriegii]
MNKLQLVLKRTLFYPTFLMLSSGLFLMDVRGLGAIGAAAAAALAIHAAVNGYEIWKQKQAPRG